MHSSVRTVQRSVIKKLSEDLLALLLEELDEVNVPVDKVRINAF